MVNVTKMQGRIDKLLSVFTSLISALESAIGELNAGIRGNEARIEELNTENATYSTKIAEYEALMESIKNVVKPTEKV